MIAQETDLSISARVFRVFVDGIHRTWAQAWAEWFDNSFAAGNARRIWVRIFDDRMEVVDDGEGCPNIKVMAEIGESLIRPGNTTSIYGAGGTISQIWACDGGVTQMETRTVDRVSVLSVDWGACIQAGKLTGAISIHPNRTRKTGTKITIHRPRKIRLREVIEAIGWRYSAKIREGAVITVEAKGKTVRVQPYSPPPLLDRLEIDGAFQGHRIAGFVGRVDPEHANPHAGITFYWGCRALGNPRFEPMGDKASRRIYGEIYLPASFTTVDVNKDGFANSFDPCPLYDWIYSQILPVLETAESESMDLDLASATQAAEQLVTDHFRDMGRRKIKGRRPNRGVKKGTVIPTGRGSEHRHFTTFQDGYKDCDVPGSLPDGEIPDQVKIKWEHGMSRPHAMLPSMLGRRRIITVELNKEDPGVFAFHRDPELLAKWCITLICAELTVKHILGENIQKNFKFMFDNDFSANLARFFKSAKIPDQVLA